MKIGLFRLLAAFLVLQSATLLAQDDILHTELDWRTVETEHFLIHFHQGNEWTARTVSSIAESVYVPLTTLYHHVPDRKVSIVLRDHDDYSNGAAYFLDNKIEIWVPAMDFELRGIHPWLQNVVTHELTHIIQIQTALKLGRRIPALYLQWFGYESERRPDVLYGFPNVLVSYPYSFFLVPSWFAEGVAQYNHPSLMYDYWDSHRDMVLRMNMIEGSTLSWEEMAVFGKTSLGNESAYNAGFSLVKYIADQYGADTLEALSRALGDVTRLTIDGAIEKVLGKPAEVLFEDWKSVKKGEYERVRERIAVDTREGQVIEPEGFGNFFPVFSPDGKSLAYISNKGKDFLGQSSVYLYTFADKRSVKLVDAVRSSVSFTPDGKNLIYAKVTSDNPHWSRVSDLFRLNLETNEEERLTYGLRAFNPDVSPDGSRIVFTFGSDGTLNLGTCRLDGSKVIPLLQVSKGTQVYTPAWSPDGSTIAFGYSRGHGQEVALVHADGSGLRILSSGGDSRNPAFSPDGSFLYYSSDRTGIFNIYVLRLADGETKQVTNVLGGAFTPSVNDGGDLVYASYSSSGYKIALMEQSTHSARESLLPPSEGPVWVPPLLAIPEPPRTNPDSKVYRNTFTSLTLIPLLRIDNYNPKNKGIDIIRPGLYGFSSDMLDKLALFGGAAMNRKLERDLFLMFEFRDELPILSSLGLEPVLSLELYSISRKTTNSFVLEPSPQRITPEITYNLFEFSASFRQPVFQEKTMAKLWYTLGRYSADIGSFINPNLPANDPSAFVPAFRNVYFVGNEFGAQVSYDGIVPDVDREINPTGRSVLVRYAYETDKFNPEGEFKIESGVLVPQYRKFIFHRAELHWSEHWALPWEDHTVTLGIRTAGILGRTVDSFFDYYAGGVLGMKGYPFYALGGNTNASASLTYRFPVSRNLHMRIFQFYFTKLFASVFCDFGEAWTGSVPLLRSWKTDAGFEIRLESFSFYAYPTRLFFSGAYGFNRFQKTFNGVPVQYGKEWRFYFGVLFGFELGDIANQFNHMRGIL